jgi:hypothetical protein
MVSDNGAEWERDPLVACADISNWPVTALAEAPTITETGCPVPTEKGLAGLLVTPAGIPVSITCTLPENPFKPLTLTLTGALELPCSIVTVLAESPIAKSGLGGGG